MTLAYLNQLSLLLPQLRLSQNLTLMTRMFQSHQMPHVDVGLAMSLPLLIARLERMNNVSIILDILYFTRVVKAGHAARSEY